MELFNKNRPVKLGVISLWLLSIFLFGFIFYIIGSNQRLFSSKYSLYIFTPNIQGLSPGAFVTVSGMKVGTVGDMEFVEKNNQQGIKVELKIKDEFDDLVTTSSVAKIKTLGILGDKFVDISPGKATEPKLAEGDFLESTEPINYENLLANVSGALDDFKVTAKNINKLTSNALNGPGILNTLLADEAVKKDFLKSINNIQRLTVELTNGKGTAGKLVRDTLLYKNLLNTTSNLNGIAQKIKNGEGSLGKFLTDTTMFSSFRSLSMRTDSLLQKLQGNGTAGKLLKDEKLYTQLLILTKSLNELTQDMKKNPGKYVSFSLF